MGRCNKMASSQNKNFYVPKRVECKLNLVVQAFRPVSCCPYTSPTLGSAYFFFRINNSESHVLLGFALMGHYLFV